MSKHLTLSHLQTILPPIKHLIDKKAEGVDWNENDRSASGYIKNRPFYEEFETEILLDGTFIFDDNFCSINYFEITLGQQYTVIFNEVEYNTTAVYLPNFNALALGNCADFGLSDTGQPFFIGLIEEGSGILTYDSNLTEATVKIFGAKLTIHKIDPKFLPEQEKVELGQGDMIGKAGTGQNAEIFNDYTSNEASGRFSHAEGYGTTACNVYTHAEGFETLASGDTSHAEGFRAKAYGIYSHAEGNSTEALEQAAHAEGRTTRAIGDYSHAEGWSTHAVGNCSHVEGHRAISYGSYSHAEGLEALSYGSGSHAEGLGSNDGNFENIIITGDANSSTYTLISGDCKVGQVFTYNSIFQHVTAINNDQVTFSGTFSSSAAFNEQKIYLCEGVSAGSYSHVEGSQGQAIGEYSHAEGYRTEALGDGSHSEGHYTIAKSQDSHAEGNSTRASGYASHAEGSSTYALGQYSHSEGSSTYAYGDSSHAEGSSATVPVKITGTGNTISYTVNFSETTKYIGWMIEYKNTLALINSATNGTFTVSQTLSAEDLTEASASLHPCSWGSASHAEGFNSNASGDYSHAEGYYTTAFGNNQHAQGKYNIIDQQNKYAHIVGNGTANARSNAHTLDWNGNAWYQGDVFVGGTDQDSGEKLAKMSDLAASITTDEINAICGVTLGINELIDETSGATYQLYVDSGKLSMREVE